MVVTSLSLQIRVLEVLLSLSRHSDLQEDVDLINKGTGCHCLPEVTQISRVPKGISPGFRKFSRDRDGVRQSVLRLSFVFINSKTSVKVFHYSMTPYPSHLFGVPYDSLVPDRWNLRGNGEDPKVPSPFLRVTLDIYTNNEIGLKGIGCRLNWTHSTREGRHDCRRVEEKGGKGPQRGETKGWTPERGQVPLTKPGTCPVSILCPFCGGLRCSIDPYHQPPLIRCKEPAL